MNGSVVMAKIAGIESTAKITSLMPIIAITMNSGVYRRLPPSTTDSAAPR